MKWTYSLERIPSPENVNDHIVQVTSRSRIRGEEIKIKFYTNMDLHAIQVRILKIDVLCFRVVEHPIHFSPRMFNR